ncbi:hypothetical protein L2E82_47134 [Cichorium intybus]|uniref:Uncharacterized protein n=1 Tax=Cichorium intybus TaxID=13427 RepID=A0ACB8YW50_CICIN|nr:hypothetical protein L2E82_47134 [Cichorium intybus]
MMILASLSFRSPLFYTTAFVALDFASPLTYRLHTVVLHTVWISVCYSLITYYRVLLGFLLFISSSSQQKTWEIGLSQQAGFSFRILQRLWCDDYVKASLSFPILQLPLLLRCQRVLALDAVSDLGVLTQTGIVHSQVFSMAETSITTLSPWKVRELAEKEDENGVFKLLRTDITLFLTTILIGTTVVNIGATAFFTKSATTVFGEAGVVVLLIIEVTPKSIAVHNATMVARAVEQNSEDQNEEEASPETYTQKEEIKIGPTPSASQVMTKDSAKRIILLCFEEGRSNRTRSNKKRNNFVLETSFFRIAEWREREKEGNLHINLPSFTTLIRSNSLHQDFC